MPWVKYVRAEHNVARGAPSLRLGTLAYYRGIEHAGLVADPGEGRFRRTVHPDRSPAARPTTEAESRRAYGTSIHISGHMGSVIVENVSPNCYAFCVTEWTRAQGPSLDEARDFGGYDDWYVIDDLGAFARELTADLASQLTRNHLDERAFQMLPASALSRLVVDPHWFGNPVEYVETRDDECVTAQAATTSFEEQLERAAFRKPLRYKAQREWRILIRLRHETAGFLPNAVGPFDIAIPRAVKLLTPRS